MKRIGIVTLGNSTNYGGVLQAVALSYTIKKYGADPVFITCKKMPSAWKSIKHYVDLRVRLYGCKGFYTKMRIFGGIWKTLLSNIHFFSAKKKKTNFEEFIDKHMNITPYYRDLRELQTKCERFDTYIVGSDQVWNFVFDGGDFDDRYFLKFAPLTAHKYSYAASVGGKKEDAYISQIINMTKDFSGIAVREKSLENHMKRLGAENVQTVLDPTLLLTRNEWIEFEKAPCMELPEHYILVYYLERSAAEDIYVKTIAEQLDLPVIDILPDYKKTEYVRLKDTTGGPAEFIYYVHHADFVITNSFHMTVFSLIFGRKFVSVPREGQESRVEDLLGKVGLKEHILTEPNMWKIILENIDEIEIQMRNEKEYSISYLRQIIGDDQ